MRDPIRSFTYSLILSFLKSLITIFLLCVLYTTKGQMATITAGGNYISKEGTVSFSIGEVVYISKGLSYNMTEGVQHSFIINPIFTNSNLLLSIYPNPTTDLLFFKLENLNYLDLSYILYDISGKILMRGTILDSKSTISLKNYASQTFILKIVRGQNEQNIFKILKIK